MKKYLGIVFIGIVLMLTSCEKNGCMDDKATNYDEEAENDDESCEYLNAVLTIYSDSARTRNLVDQMTSTPITIYVNDENVGTLNYYNYLDNEPSCNDNFSGDIYKEVLKHSYKMSSGEESVYIYFEDNAGNRSASRIEYLISGECLPFKI